MRAIASGTRLYYNLAMSAPDVSRTNPSHPPAARGFFRALWRALRQLFHEATGAVFAIMGLTAATSALRTWQHGGEKWIVALPLLYSMMMAYFSVTSFRSARRVE
jgi:hypothetical protein